MQGNNATNGNNSLQNVPTLSMAPPVTTLFPYTSIDKSALQELVGSPLTPGPSSQSLSPSNMTYVPAHFLSKFDDLAYLKTNPNKKPSNVTAKTTPKNIEKKAVDNLALVTNTNSNCYQIEPMNVSNITAVS